MKVIITGASGLLGRAIKKELEKVTSWQTLGLGFSRLDGGLRNVDLTDEQAVHDVINEFKPDVVIHSAAERRPDVVGNKMQQTEALNVTATETLAKCVNKIGGFLLYISTDYVFDGTTPPYTPKSQPNPLNKYGVTKLEGEKETIRNCERHGILRVPILYGDVEFIKESAVTGLLQVLKDKDSPSNVSNYELRYPTNTADVAVVCRQIVERREKVPTFGGVWHWQGNERLTKYGMIQIMSKLFDLPMEHITPVNEPTSSQTPRPYHCQLDCSVLESVAIGQTTSFEIWVKEHLQKYV